jgi:hypothetical protein
MDLLERMAILNDGYDGMWDESEAIMREVKRI